MILILAVWIACQKDAIDPGLIAWRTPDNAGRSCSSCHSPDGIELAAYGFAKDDLVRRAARHLTEERQTQVVNWILQNRVKIHGKVVNPMMGRPLQPGGKVLPGFTPKERDLAFQTSLGSASPKLEGARIRSLKAAKEIRDEVLDLDLKSLPVGIEMNRLSEDGFHGRDHATLAHWIPDVPVAAGDPIRLAEDAYLREPEKETLIALDQTVLKLAPHDSPIQVLALNKYRSLLRLQHLMRTGNWVGNDLDNPFWQVAEIARTCENFDGSQLGLDKDLQFAKSSGPAFPDQMRQMRLPWYWLGWIEDPGISHSGGRGETKRADYFTQTLLKEGPYPAHAVFMLLRKLCEQQRKPTGRPFEIQYSLLLLNQPFTDFEPQQEDAKRQFRRIAGNAFRTTLFLLNEDLKSTNRCVLRESQLLQIRQIDRYLTAIGEPERTLIDETTKLLLKANRVP